MGDFFNIILRSLKFEKSVFADNKNFGEASIYYSIIIILAISILGMVPGSTLYKSIGNLPGIEVPSLRKIIITSFVVWLIKTAYLYFVGIVIFPSKSTKCTFRKLLITVAYAHSPFFLYILIFNINLIYFAFLIYIWYCIILIIGMKEVLKYENYFKPTIISLAPQFILFIYFLSLILNVNSGTIS